MFWAVACFVVPLALVVGFQVWLAAYSVRGADPALRNKILDTLQETRVVHRFIVRMFRPGGRNADRHSDL